MKIKHIMRLAAAPAALVAFINIIIPTCPAADEVPIDVERAKGLMQKKQSDGTLTADDPIDMKRLHELHTRVKKGEKLSAEEQAYYERGAEARKVQQKRRGQPQATPSLSADETLKQASREETGRASEAFAVSEQDCPLETIEVPAAEGHKVLGVLRKPPGPGPFPALVHLHGTLDIKSLASLQAWTRDATPSRFLAAGYVLVTPTFRSRTEDPQTRNALVDCLTMIDYVKKRSDVDPRSVVVWGDSGGGSLALELAGETDLAAIAAQE